MAQGFVTAQDRLFQMELTRLFASGRIAELAGEKARDLDIRMRTLGFHRNARKHADNHFNHLSRAHVITSYSIHYTKLYDMPQAKT